MGQTTEAISQGTAVAFQTTATATGSMTSLSVYVNGGSTATPLIAGLYSNNQNHPGSLLAQGTLSNPVAGTNKVPLQSATKVIKGSIYWIAILNPKPASGSSGLLLQFSDAVGGALQPSETMIARQTTSFTKLPNTWTGTTDTTHYGPLSAYGSGSLGSICPCSIWGAGATPPAKTTPTLVDELDTSAVEVGVKFKSDVQGSITGIRFYKASTNTGTHVGNLWTSTGTLLASATFTSETASGWQQVNFATPVAITANTVYVASYHTNVGHYAADAGYFTATGIDNPPLHALRDGTSGSNSVYRYGATSGFPTNAYQSSNYWVDVVFTTP